MNDPQRSGGDATPENTRGAPTRRERAKRVRRERAHVSVRPSGATQESQSRRSVRWAIGVTIAVAVIGAFLLLFGKPIYKAWQGRKIPGLLAEARAKMEAGDLRGAHNLAAVAYQIDRSDTDANRVLATIHTVLGSDTAFYLWKNVENSGEATDEDLRNIARAYITQGYLPEAERLVNKLLEQDPEAKENLEIDAELNLARDDMQAAGMAIDRILAANPDGFDKKISDAFAKLESPFQESRAAGWMVLFDVAEGGGDPGYNALRAILQKSEILPEDRVNQLRELLVATETARDRLWIEAMEWETKLAPERREEIYAEKLEEVREEPVKFFRLVRWLLYEQKEHRFLADKITLEDAIRNPLVVSSYLDILRLNGKWDGIDEVLNSAHIVNIPDSQRLLYRSYYAIYKEGADSESVDKNLEACLKAAEQERYYLLAPTLAKLAETVGREEVANGAYALALSNPRAPKDLFDTLIDHARRQRDTMRIWNIAGEMARRFPGRESVLIDFSYLSLIVGGRIEVAFETSARLRARATLQDSERITLALALYRMRDLESAYQVCQAVNPDELTDGQKAVYVAVLTKAGDREDAREVAAQISNYALLQEERDLIKEWINDIEVPLELR